MGRSDDVLTNLERHDLVRSQGESHPTKYAPVEPETGLDRLLDERKRALHERAQQYEDTVLVQFETTIPLLLFALEDSGVPLTMPFTIREGQAEWELTAPQHRLSELGTKLEEFGIPFTVNEISQRVEPEQLLTDRQLDLVERAIESGYYDTPRRCSLTALADEVDLAKSTCSETLHRAEEKIVKQFVEIHEDATVAPVRP